MILALIAGITAPVSDTGPRVPQVPLQHYAPAPVAEIRQVYACFGRRLELSGIVRDHRLRLNALSGFTGATEQAREMINARLARLPDIDAIAVSCADAGQHIQIDALPQDPGPAEHLGIYMRASGPVFFPK